MERVAKAESIQKSTIEEICTLEKDCGGKCRTLKLLVTRFLMKFMANSQQNVQIQSVSFIVISLKAHL